MAGVDHLAPSVVRVLRGGEPVGMGCLVTPRHVVTCAHVIVDARGADDRVAPAAGMPVRVDFPLVRPGEPVDATVAVWSPPPAAGGRDVAVLVLHAVPEGAAPARVIATDAVWGHSVRAFGVPAGQDAGVWAVGVVRGRAADGLIQVEDERSSGFPVSRGFSGAPVWDEAVAGVIGIVAEAERDPARRTGYLLPGDLLGRVWPELDRLSAFRSPFRGLRPFREADAEHFHGREELTGALVERLVRTGFVVLAGPSGSGKSSVAFAGVAASLRARGFDVVSALPASGVPPPPVAAGSRALLVIVDQFEQAVTGAPAELLRGLVPDGTGGTREDVAVLVTVRSDAIGALVTHPGVAELFDGRIALLGPPTRREVRAMIEQPMRAAGMPRYEPGLVERILADLPERPASLALLQFTLTLLWERQRGGIVTHAAYDSIGGVAGAMAGYAESVWRDGLDERTRPVARRLFCQLLSPLGEGGYTRRRLLVDELDPEMATVVDALTTTRLLTVDDRDGGRVVELAHEELVAGWQRLREWIDSERELRRWQDSLRRHLDAWRQAGRERALLLRGSALATATGQLRAHSARMLPAEVGYVRASVRGRRRSWAVRAIAAALVLVLLTGTALVWRQQVAQQRAETANRLRAAADQTLADGEAAAQTLRQRLLVHLRAYAIVDTPRTRARLHADQVSLAHATRVLDVAGTDRWAVSPDGTALVVADPVTNRFTVHHLGRDHHSEVNAVDPDDGDGGYGITDAITFVGPDTVALAGHRAREDAFVPVVELWDLDADAHRRTIAAEAGDDAGADEDAPVTLLADRAGTVLVYGRPGSRTVRLLDPGGADPPRTVDLGGPLVAPGRTDGVRVLAARGPSELLVADEDRTVVLITADSRTPLPTVRDGGLVWSDADDLVMWGCLPGERTFPRMVVYGLADRREYSYQEVPDHRCEAAEHRLDHSGRYLISRYEPDGEGAAVLEVVDLVAGGVFGRRFPVPANRTDEPNTIAAAAISDDGSGRVVLRNGDTAVALRIPPADSPRSAVAAAENAVVSGDGSLLYTQLLDGSVEAWRLADGERLGSVAAPAPRSPFDVFLPKAMRLSPDGRLLATGTAGSPEVNLWELPGLTRRGTLELPHRPVADQMRLSFAGDGSLLTVQGDLQGILVGHWELGAMRTQWAPITLPRRREEDGTTPVSARFVLPAGDRDQLIVIDSDGRVRRVSVPDGEVVAGSQFPLPLPTSAAQDLTAVAAGPAGELLAVATAGRVEVWDLTSNTTIDTLEVDQWVHGLRFGAHAWQLRIEVTASGRAPTGGPDLGVSYRPLQAARTLVWSRSGDQLPRERVREEPGPAGRSVVGVAPVPHLLPVPPPAWAAALCRAIGADDLPASLLDLLPAPARGQVACS